MASEDDAVFLRPDAQGVVHMGYYGGSFQRAFCSTWNQNLTGNGLVWGVPLPHDVPTCIYCIYYHERERRLHLTVRELGSVLP